MTTASKATSPSTSIACSALRTRRLQIPEEASTAERRNERWGSLPTSRVNGGSVRMGGTCIPRHVARSWRREIEVATDQQDYRMFRPHGCLLNPPRSGPLSGNGLYLRRGMALYPELHSFLRQPRPLHEESRVPTDSQDSNGWVSARNSELPSLP